MNAVKDLIDTAQKWNGYLEKKSSKGLDDFTANAGSGNRMQFLAPHYAQNNTILRFGLSWNFFN